MITHYFSALFLSIGLLIQPNPFCYAEVNQSQPLASSLPEELELEAYQHERADEKTLARVAYGRSITERAKTGVVAIMAQSGPQLTKYLYQPFEDVVTKGEALQVAGQAKAAEELYAKTLTQLNPQQAKSSSARRLQQQLYLLESARGQKNAEQRLANLTVQVLEEWGLYSDLYSSLLYEQIRYYDRTHRIPALTEALQKMSFSLQQRERSLAAFLLNDFEYDTFLTLHQRYIDQLLSMSVKYHNEQPQLTSLVANYLLVSRNLQLNGQRILREHFIVRSVADLSIAVAMSVGVPYLQEKARKNPPGSKEHQDAIAEIERRSIIKRDFDVKAQRHQLYAAWNSAKLNPNTDKDNLNYLEHQLIDSVGRFIDQLVMPGTDAIFNRLRSDQAIVDFFSYEKETNKSDIQYAAVIYRKQPSTPNLVLLGSRAEIWQLLSQQQMNSSTSTYQLMSSINQLYKSPRLYELIWKPLVPMLNGIRQVDYLPVDLLNVVAFDALLPESGEKLLGEKFDIKRVLTIPSAFVDSVIIAPDKLSERQVNADFWGGITYNKKAEKRSEESRPIGIPLRGSVTTLTRGRNWDELKGTEEEIGKAQNLFKVFKARHLSLYTKSKASEFAFKFQYTNLSQPHILHIATHGFYDQMTLAEPHAGGNTQAFTYNETMLKAGLVLAGANIRPEAGQEDGILTALEISRLNLNSKLVVLSACESGLGEQKGNEGIFGLQRAFKLAGAEFLLMTLWQIPDQETIDMMSFFYGNLSKGQSIETAFRNAQTSMKSRYSPFFWAGFVLLR